MTLVALTVIVIVLLVAVLTNYLFLVGMLLNRIAENLGDCLQSVKNIRDQAELIGPGVISLNHIGKELVGALPLLYGSAERLIDAKPAPVAATPSGLGYLDV
ncbi:MAG: hypothetical protein ACRDTG_03500 [Pseudonocardiaceae bacterium]